MIEEMAKALADQEKSGIAETEKNLKEREKLIAMVDARTAPAATRPVEVSRLEKNAKPESTEQPKEGMQRPAPVQPVMPPDATAAQAAAASGGGGSSGGGAGVPGARAEEADPAPQSDSESDPFSTRGNVTITAGRIEARLGRDVKPVKPRLRIKAGLDVYSIANASVTLLAKIDAAGKVTDVRIVKSSGSNDIDLPTVVAMYKWWIEPARDKAGKPIEDALQITFLFR
jgi:TonB family protein